MQCYCGHNSCHLCNLLLNLQITNTGKDTCVHDWRVLCKWPPCDIKNAICIVGSKRVWVVLHRYIGKVKNVNPQDPFFRIISCLKKVRAESAPSTVRVNIIKHYSITLKMISSRNSITMYYLWIQGFSEYSILCPLATKLNQI